MCSVCSGSGVLPRAKRLRKDIFGTAAPAAAAAWSSSAAPMVVLFYKYVALSDVASEISFFGRVARAQHMRGRVLLASEGVNANLVAPSAAHMAAFTKAVGSRAGFDAIDWKTEVTHASSASTLFGTDLVIKEVSEIVSSGGKMPFKLLAEGHGGTHYTPEEFHAILKADCAAGGGGAKDGATAAKPLVVLDIRNSKEFAVGHFAGAEDPGTKSHAEMAGFLAQRAPALKESKVLMYCTGGIRCEKASALLKSMGVPDVGQLSGGVVRYLERFGDDGFFRGANFVFDGRRAQRAPVSALAASAAAAGSSVATTGDASASTSAAQPRASPTREVIGKCGCCGVAEDSQVSLLFIAVDILCESCSQFDLLPFQTSRAPVERPRVLRLSVHRSGVRCVPPRAAVRSVLRRARGAPRRVRSLSPRLNSGGARSAARRAHCAGAAAARRLRADEGKAPHYCESCAPHRRAARGARAVRRLRVSRWAARDALPLLRPTRAHPRRRVGRSSGVVRWAVLGLGARRP